MRKNNNNDNIKTIDTGDRKGVIDLSFFVTIFVFGMFVPLRGSGFRVDTCPFYHVEAVAVIAFLQNLVGLAGNTDITATDDFCVVAVKFFNLVGVVTEIQFYSPVPVFGTDDVAADGQFDTLVFHLTYILPAGSHTGDTGYGYLEQDV